MRLEDRLYEMRTTTYEGMILHVAEDRNGNPVYVTHPERYISIGMDEEYRTVHQYVPISPGVTGRETNMESDLNGRTEPERHQD